MQDNFFLYIGQGIAMATTVCKFLVDETSFHMQVSCDLNENGTHDDPKV